MNSDQPYDLSALEGMTPGQMLLKIRRDLEFAMPKRGVTKSEMSLGGNRWTRTVWRCEKEGCWYVATPSSDANLADIQRVHATGAGNSNPCPSPPRREELPSGLSEVEKLWREIDDVVDKILNAESYREMEQSEMRGYLKGLAFSVVMKDRDLFPDIKSVSREARERRKMRHNLIPWRPTPTHQAKHWAGGHNLPGGWAPVEPAAVMEKKPPVKKATPRKVTVPAEKVKQIRFALESGMLPEDSIAQMYGVSVAVVQKIKAS